MEMGSQRIMPRGSLAGFPRGKKEGFGWRIFDMQCLDWVTSSMSISIRLGLWSTRSYLIRWWECSNREEIISSRVTSYAGTDVTKNESQTQHLTLIIDWCGCDLPLVEAMQSLSMWVSYPHSFHIPC